MKKVIFGAAVCLMLTASDLIAQTIVKRDPVIESMVSGISNSNIEKTINSLVGFHSRHNMTPRGEADKGLWASVEWAKKEIEKSIPASGGRLSIEIVKYKAGGAGTRIAKELELPNLVATLKGVDTTDDRVLVVSAHIDTRVERDDDFESFAPGANDDGSGVAAIMEIVRLMSAHPFPATIKFMLVSGEEHGLLGAKFMADKAKAEGWNVVAMLNNDMIGNSGSSETLLNDNMRLRVFSEGIPAFETEAMARVRKATSGENDSRARQLARYIKEVGERYVDQLEVVLIYRNDRFGRGGDHTPFAQNGFTAVRLTEFNENYDRTHQSVRNENEVAYGDVISGVDIDYVRKNAGVNLATLASLASAPRDPQEVGLITGGLTNRTELVWKAPEGGKAPVGYYLLLRQTSSPVWERKIFTTQTSITIPYSKDNYFFAVQAVDELGHESMIQFPSPITRRR